MLVAIRNVLFTPQHGESALHIAAGYGHLSVVKLLIKSGAKLDSKDKVFGVFYCLVCGYYIPHFAYKIFEVNQSVNILF